MLLGDAVKTALEKVGITEERVEKVLGRPCGCKKRRELLNRLHLWATGQGELPEEIKEADDVPSR